MRRVVTHYILDLPVSLKLIPRKLPALRLGGAVLDAFRAAEDGSVETYYTLSLQELAGIMTISIAYLFSNKGDKRKRKRERVVWNHLA